jgi:ferredoxin-like protein FixX
VANQYVVNIRGSHGGDDMAFCSRCRARGGTQSAQGCRPPRYPRRCLTFICSLPGHKSHRPRDSSQACAWLAMPSLLCYSHSIRYLYHIETDACQWAEQDILLLLPCPASSAKPLPAAGSMRTDDSLYVNCGTCMILVIEPGSRQFRLTRGQPGSRDRREGPL